MKKLNIFDRFLKILEIIFGIIVFLLLLLYAYILIKSHLFPEKVPDVFGYKPLIVLSGSMEPSINKGDLVFVKEIDEDLLKLLLFYFQLYKILFHLLFYLLYNFLDKVYILLNIL